MLVDKLIVIFSREMRATLELEHLNTIWERFNNGEDVLYDILDRKWKYHKDKVRLLLTFIYLKKCNP